MNFPWNKVEKTQTCWFWRGGTNGKGYGLIRTNGRRRVVHRVAWESLRGPIPTGLELDHLCRVRLCVNPEHLEVVTGTTNILRGISPTAINARKTQCIHGHNFNAENTYIDPRGKRACKECQRIRQHSGGYFNAAS